MIAVLLVAAALVATGVTLYELRRPAPAAGTSEDKTLIPAGTIDSFPGGQVNAEAFIITVNSHVNGTFTTTFGIDVYAMSTSQFQAYLRAGGTPTAFEWTSGAFPNETVESIDVHLAPGAWDVAFVNPNPVLSTMVGYLTNLTLSPE